MKVRYATLEDSKDVFGWRNDEVTRLMSVNTGIIDWKEHVKWYSSEILDTSNVIIIGEDVVGKIGLVKIKYDDDRTQAEIDINLNPIRRRQGLSSSFLNESICFAKPPDNIRLIARIKRKNVASIRCFYKCKFHYNDSDNDYIYLVTRTIPFRTENLAKTLV